MADRRPLTNVNGTIQEMPSGDKVPVAALATGTPDGTKFLRDDGAWVAPTGSGGAISNLISVPTTIAADTSYVVVDYLTITSDLTVNGNVGVL